MRKSIITLAIVLLAVAAQAQIKMHNNGRITFQTLANTTGQGISIGPAPNWNVDFNGDVYFHKHLYCTYNAGAYALMSCAIVNNDHAVAWMVSPDWSSANFFVYGKGDSYAKNHYIISNRVSDETSKGGVSESIDGQEALEVVKGLKGYYYAPEEQEIPDLENNEFVDPEAVEAMRADFEKRTAGLYGSNVNEVFPEAVRTDPKNRLCIDYQSVVTMLVEAVKEQQHEIEDLRRVLEDKGLIKK